MSSVLHSQPFLLALTVGVFYAALLLYRRTRSSLLNPILVSIIIIIPLLSVSGISFDEYYRANSPVNFLLGLSVVAIGYLMYENLSHIRGRELQIVAAVAAGSLAGVLCVMGIATWTGIAPEVSLSLQPKSVTNPIAIELSRVSGGIPALTSVAVIFTGIFGSIVGPWVFRVTGITDDIARGIGLGSAAHAVGTAKALEISAAAGAAGGVAIAGMGIATAVVLPLAAKLLG
ncbi:MAG: LrgB family protein [Rikenellaceae bacterium]|nr:LrgB family protein [Rikenellaceae bacterium]